MEKAASLRDRLSRYDGKHTSPLQALLNEQRNSANTDAFWTAVIALVSETEAAIADGATWMIHQHLKSGGTLSDTTGSALVRATPHLPTWQSQLHLCQSVRFLRLSPKDAAILAEAIPAWRTHTRPFLRAWSLDALVAIAAQHPRYQTEADAAVADARNDPAASVRARARSYGS